MEDKVIEVVSEVTGHQEIQLEYTLQGNLGVDSLCAVMLLVAIEDAFEIELDESDMNPLNLITVADIVNMVRKYCRGADEENC